MNALKPAIARAAVYLVTLGLGAVAAWFVTRGYGTYNELTGDLTLTVNVNVIATYIGSMIGGGGLAFVALVKGWGK